MKYPEENYPKAWAAINNLNHSHMESQSFKKREKSYLPRYK